MTLRREVETSSNLAITSLLYPNRHSDSGIVFYAHIHRSLVVDPIKNNQKCSKMPVRSSVQIHIQLVQMATTDHETSPWSPAPPPSPPTVGVVVSLYPIEWIRGAANKRSSRWHTDVNWGWNHQGNTWYIPNHGYPWVMCFRVSSFLCGIWEILRCVPIFIIHFRVPQDVLFEHLRHDLWRALADHALGW